MSSILNFKVLALTVFVLIAWVWFHQWEPSESERRAPISNLTRASAPQTHSERTETATHSDTHSEPHALTEETGQNTGTNIVETSSPSPLERSHAISNANANFDAHSDANSVSSEHFQQAMEMRYENHLDAQADRQIYRDSASEREFFRRMRDEEIAALELEIRDDFERLGAAVESDSDLHTTLESNLMEKQQRLEKLLQERRDNEWRRE